MMTFIPSNLNSNEEEVFMDLMQGLSPQIATLQLSHERALYLCLKPVWEKYNLSQLAQAIERTQHFDSTEPAAHSFLEKVRQLAERYSLHFVVAPTKNWALWASTHIKVKHPFISFYAREEIKPEFHHAPLSSGKELITDAFGNSFSHKNSLRAKWNYFESMARELKILSLGDLEKHFASPAHDRLSSHPHGNFSLIAQKLLARIAGSDEWTLPFYQARSFLRASYQSQQLEVFEAENLVSKNPLQTIRDIFDSWQERLKARESIVKTLSISIKFRRSVECQELIITMATASNNAENLYGYFYKYFLDATTKNLSEDTHFDDYNPFDDREAEIDEILIQSTLIKSHQSTQFDLFERPDHNYDFYDRDEYFESDERDDRSMDPSMDFSMKSPSPFIENTEDTVVRHRVSLILWPLPIARQGPRTVILA